MDDGNEKGFLKLLLAFNSLPLTKSRPTFMEVSGYPHYENVCSNILKFYFDTTAEHGLKDLLLSAFLRMAGKESVIPGAVTVSREYPSTNQTRIDLVIKGESFVIAIENKIFHWVANDLDGYASTVDSLAKGEQFVIKTVLGLHPIKDTLKGGFVSFTYDKLWREVRNQLGYYITQANPKWVTYLLDFMETTTNLAGQNMELKQADQFFIEHNDAIETMLTERKAFLSRLTYKISILIDMIKETTEATALDIPPFLYGKDVKDRLVLNFKKLGGDYDVSFDFFLTPAGWDLQLFGRNPLSQDYLLKLINQSALKEKMQSAFLKGEKYHVQKWDVQADLGEIKDALRGWLAAVSQAASALPQAKE